MGKKKMLKLVKSEEFERFEKFEKKNKKNKDKSKDKSFKKEKISRNHDEEIKRLNRIGGQLEGITKMLNNGRDLQDVLTQFKAVHSAINSVQQRVFDNYVHHSVEDIISAEKRKEREKKIDELKQLYRQQ